MKCFYDGSQKLLKGRLVGGEVVCVSVLAEGADAVRLVYTEQIHAVFSVAKKAAIEMSKTEGGFECALSLPSRPIRYWFELSDKQGTLYYTAGGLTEAHGESLDGDFIIVPDFDTPEWTKGAVWYQIMPDSFFNGDTLSDKSNANGTTVNTWGQARRGMNDYYGGDLLGIARKIEYLKSLNVEVVSINPVWMTNHQAGYGSFDIEQVDATFGGVNALKNLIEVLHENGIKLVLDGVFQYYHRNGKLYNEGELFPLIGAYQTGKNEAFISDALGRVVPGQWEYPFDFSSKEARNAIAGDGAPVKRYLEIGADGWRLDVGNTYEGTDQNCYGTCDTALGFIYDAVKDVGEDKLVLTEHPWGEMFTSKKCESKWNYDFGYPIRDWAAGKLDSESALKRIKTAVFSLPRPVMQSSFNFLTTHDLSRLLHHVGGDENGYKAALAVQFAFVGAPSIYSGDEIGVVGDPAEFISEKAPTSFGSFEWNEEKQNAKMLGIYRDLTALRKIKKELFVSGTCLAKACGDNAIAVARRLCDDCVIAIGNKGKKQQITLDLPLILEGTYVDIISGTTARSIGGKFNACVDSGCAVYVLNFKNRYINGYEIVGGVSYSNGKYLLEDGAMLKGRVFGCFDVEIDTSCETTVGSVKITDGIVCVGKSCAKRVGAIRIQRNTADEVLVFDGEKEILREKTADGYTVPLTVCGGGELAISILPEKQIKLVADEENGFNGMFDLVSGNLQTRFLNGDFSVRLSFDGDGSVELATDGASIGLEIKDKEVAFIRDISGICEKLSAAKASDSVVLQRVEGLVSAYAVYEDGVKKLGEIKANYSSSWVRVSGKIKSVVFGDGCDLSLPVGGDYTCFDGAGNEMARGLFGLEAQSGAWQGCEEGICMTTHSGELVTKKVYGDFEAYFSLKGRLCFKVGKCEIVFEDGGNESFAIKRKGGEIRVYRGLPLKYYKTVAVATGEEKLHFEFFNEGAVLANFWVQEYDAEWTVLRGNCYFNRLNELRFKGDQGDFWVASSKSYSDIALAANVRFNKAESQDDGDFFVLLGHSPYAQKELGLALRITHSKTVEVILNGEVVSSTAVADLDVNSFFLRLIKDGKRVSVSIAPSCYDKEEREVMTCELPFNVGGRLSFYGRRISGAVAEFGAWCCTCDEFKQKKVAVAKSTYIWLC